MMMNDDVDDEIEDSSGNDDERRWWFNLFTRLIHFVLFGFLWGCRKQLCWDLCTVHRISLCTITAPNGYMHLLVHTIISALRLSLSWLWIKLISERTRYGGIDCNNKFGGFKYVQECVFECRFVVYGRWSLDIKLYDFAIIGRFVSYTNDALCLLTFISKSLIATIITYVCIVCMQICTPYSNIVIKARNNIFLLLSQCVVALSSLSLATIDKRYIYGSGTSENTTYFPVFF